MRSESHLALRLRGHWPRHRRHITSSELQDGSETEFGSDNALRHVRVGIARQHRDIADTITEIEYILQAAGEQTTSGDLTQKLLQSKKALSSHLADSYDALRKCDAQEITAKWWEEHNRPALERSLIDRLATRERYENPFSIVMFFIEGNVEVAATIDTLHELVRVTDRAFSLNEREYVVVLPETDLAGALMFADRAAEELTELVGARSFAGVTAAIDGDCKRTILNRADTALYRAKMDEQHFIFSHDGVHMEARVSTGQHELV